MTPNDAVTDSTPAIEAVERAGIPFEVVRTERAHSAEESAALQGIELGALLRTIVVRRGEDDYVFVLVPGGRRFDWPKVRAHLGVKRLSLPDADEAHRVTGYERGAITPFGATRAWPVIVDASASGLERGRDRRRGARRQPPSGAGGPRRGPRRRARRRDGAGSVGGRRRLTRPAASAARLPRRASGGPHVARSARCRRPPIPVPRRSRARSSGAWRGTSVASAVSSTAGSSSR